MLRLEALSLTLELLSLLALKSFPLCAKLVAIAAAAAKSQLQVRHVGECGSVALELRQYPLPDRPRIRAQALLDARIVVVGAHDGDLSRSDTGVGCAEF